MVKKKKVLVLKSCWKSTLIVAFVFTQLKQCSQLILLAFFLPLQLCLHMFACKNTCWSRGEAVRRSSESHYHVQCQHRQLPILENSSLLKLPLKKCAAIQICPAALHEVLHILDGIRPTAATRYARHNSKVNTSSFTNLIALLGFVFTEPKGQCKRQDMKWKNDTNQYCTLALSSVLLLQAGGMDAENRKHLATFKIENQQRKDPKDAFKHFLKINWNAAQV